MGRPWLGLLDVRTKDRPQGPDSAGLGFRPTRDRAAALGGGRREHRPSKGPPPGWVVAGFSAPRAFVTPTRKAGCGGVARRRKDAAFPIGRRGVLPARSSPTVARRAPARTA